jgi:hypothetical protein
LFVVTIVAACAVNVVVFLAGPRWNDSLFAGMGRCWRDIRQHDEDLGLCIQQIRSRYDPRETILCHAVEYITFGLRHFQIYLPEFDQYQMATDAAMITPAGKPMIGVRAGRLRFVSGIDPADDRKRVLVVPPGQEVGIFEPYFGLKKAHRVTDMLYELRPCKRDF